MGEFFKAELKDRFLKYALNRSDYFEIQVLYEEFLHPNYSLNFVVKLVRDIREYDSGILDVMSGNGAEVFMLASTPKTQDFLNGGGFTDMYIKEEEKWDVFVNQLSDKRESSKDSTLLLHENSLNLKREKTLLIIIISAVVVSFLFTIFGILKEVFLEPRYIPIDEFDRKIELLKSEYIRGIDSLKFDLKKTELKLDSLQKEFSIK
ncbi:hypothetical protein HME9304_00516 [Flagellimonas maritima]|uniref:Uncharacterized protein n=1 Tax=Flagellimonas maritima TaxID=1383885 RepID=A0A2Z4LQJ9_9FLAO|nr:hypothetical protein [Allomuricauda aurantiaca]AWX43527.1 hypothetical protein HME9304_00516 [Allomuricauda aurantiaca]